MGAFYCAWILPRLEQVEKRNIQALWELLGTTTEIPKDPIFRVFRNFWASTVFPKHPIFNALWESRDPSQP
jgi:hypothetical protein